MSRASRRRHPRRVHRWEGLVDNIAEGQLWCRLIPVDHDGPELWAAFEVERLSDVQAGDLFNLYVWRRGRKVRTVLRRRDLGAWTAEELADLGNWMGESP